MRKLVITSQNPYTSVGGVEVFLRRLLDAFPEAVAIQGRAGTVCEWNHPGLETLKGPSFKPRSLSFVISFFCWLTRHGKDVDVLVVNRVEHFVAALFAGLAARTVVVVHGSSKYAPLYFGRVGTAVNYLLEWVAVKLSREVVVLMGESPAGLPYYRGRYKSTKVVGGSVLIPPGPSLGAAYLGSGCLQLLYLGRVEDLVKRVTALLEVSRELQRASIDHVIHVFGDGPDRERLESSVRAQGLSESFRFGRVDDVDDLSGPFHVALIMSRFEGMCMSALELLSRGVPVLTTDVGDMREYALWGATVIVESPQEATPSEVGVAIGRRLVQDLAQQPQWHLAAVESGSFITRRWFTAAMSRWYQLLGDQ